MPSGELTSHVSHCTRQDLTDPSKDAGQHPLIDYRNAPSETPIMGCLGKWRVPDSTRTIDVQPI